MIKAIIFDCFGVLVGKGFWNVYRLAGGDPEADHEYIDHWLNLANTGKVSQPEFRQAMADKLGLTVPQYLEIYNADEKPNQDIFDYIKTIKPQYKIGLLSNANAGVIESRIPADLLTLFDARVISAEVGMLKPTPAIYQLVADKLGVKPEEAVFTDDHQQYLPGATAVGMHSILFTGVDDFRKQLAELTAADLG